MSASEDSPRNAWDESSLKIGLATELDSAVRTLEQLWMDIGIDEEQRSARMRAIHEHVAQLLHDMVVEEGLLKERIERNLESYIVELAKLCSELALPEPELGANSSLLRREQEARQTVDTLAAEKSQRLRTLKHLSDARAKLHERLGLDAICSSPTSQAAVPSRECLQRLEEIVSDLDRKRAKRFGVLLEKRACITAALDELGIGPGSPFEFEVTNEPECFCLSDENMTALFALEDKMERKVTEYKSEAELLRKKLMTLWRRLDVPDLDQEDFLATHHGHSAPVLEMLKAEIIRCEQLKAERLESMIAKVREEISNLWSMCHFGPKQRSAFKAFTSSAFTDDLLEVHEREARKLEDQYEANAARLYEPLAKRAKLWASMLDFDARERDPARYNNRGGGLLKEEKERKKVLRDLPKIEQEIKETVEAWELENGCDFLVYDCRLVDYCKQQWDEYHHQKEEEKLDRQKAKTKPVHDAVHVKPPTPMKRPNDGGMSPPRQTPKVRKLNDTATPAGLRSFARQPPAATTYASPAFKQLPHTPSSQKKVPGTLTKACSMQSVLAPSNKANILGSTMARPNTPMKKTNSGPVHGKSSVRGEAVPSATVSTVPSYTEFKGGIAKQDKEDYHSSTILHNST